MAFKGQALRKAAAKLSENPENILIHGDDTDSLFTCLSIDKVSFKVWKRVELENKRLKMKVVEVQIDRESFIKTVK